MASFKMSAGSTSTFNVYDRLFGQSFAGVRYRELAEISMFPWNSFGVQRLYLSRTNSRRKISSKAIMFFFICSTQGESKHVMLIACKAYPILPPLRCLYIDKRSDSLTFHQSLPVNRRKVKVRDDSNKSKNTFLKAVIGVAFYKSPHWRFAAEDDFIVLLIKVLCIVSQIFMSRTDTVTYLFAASQIVGQHSILSLVFQVNIG